MSSSSRPPAGNIVAAGILGIALAIVGGAAALGAVRQVAPSPAPSATPTPVASPSATPASPATPVPTSTPGGVRIVVLNTTDDKDPRIIVDDQTGRLSHVFPGQAGDGMSTRWNTALVDQVDPNTVRVTWVGFPGEAEIGLAITADDKVTALVFDQMAPYANTDALGADRVLYLTFDRGIDADKIEVGFPSVEASF
jgi:hypothetical protein